MSKPTLILVHGSWHSPQHFGPIIQDLESHGYKCIAVDLPSTQTPGTPPASLTDDTNAVRNAVLAELDSANNDVVVVAHSYGGTPTNNALYNLSTKARIASNHKTSVKAIAFINAIPLPVGRTFLQNLGGKPHPLHDLRTPEFAWVGLPGPEYYFYNEMQPEEAKKWSSLLRQQSWKAYCEETTHASWGEIPCSYLRCRKDQALPYEVQRMIIQGAEEGGVVMGQETIDGDHTPFIGHLMDATSEFIRRVAEGKI